MTLPMKSNNPVHQYRIFRFKFPIPIHNEYLHIERQNQNLTERIFTGTIPLQAEQILVLFPSAITVL